MNAKKIILPVVILALAVGGFIALKATKPVQPPVKPQERIWRVETVLIAPQTRSPMLALTGKLESPELTRAAAPGVGRVARVWVREGQAVQQGQRLLELDARDFQPKVEQARGQVEELHAAVRGEEMRHASDLDQLAQEQKLLDFAAADVKRFEQLQRDNFYSQAAVDQSRSSLARQQLSLRSRELAIADHKARLAQLNARLTQARATLDQAELALQRSRVQAAFAGFVAKVEVAEGDQVNGGQALIALYPAAGLEVRAKIPAPAQAEIVSRLARGETLTATAGSGEGAFPLKLVRVAGAADTRGLDGFFRVESARADVRVGALLGLHLQRPAVADAVAVPFGALYGGNSLYKVVDGRLKAVQVEVLGEGDTGQLLVKSAELKADDQVLATHLPNAVTGLRVEALK